MKVGRAPGQGPLGNDARGSVLLSRGDCAQMTTTSRDAVASFLLYLAASGVSPGTLKLRRHYLEDLEGHVGDLLAATTADLVRWLSRPRWAAETRKSARATVRTFYAWAVDEELLATDPARRLLPVRVPRAVPRPVPLKVFAAALLRADAGGRRALLLARYSGLRRAEVAALHSKDVLELRDGRRAVRVLGKGGKVRVVPLHPKVADALQGVEGWIFPGRAEGTHITPDALGDRVSDLLGPGWTMHTLRHRAAADWYAVDKDLRAVQELLGHASLATTQRYVPFDDDAAWAAVLGVA